MCSLVVMEEFHDCFGPDKHLVHGALVELTLLLEINLIRERDVRLHHTVGNKHLDTPDRAPPGVVGCKVFHSLALPLSLLDHQWFELLAVGDPDQLSECIFKFIGVVTEEFLAINIGLNLSFLSILTLLLGKLEIIVLPSSSHTTESIRRVKRVFANVVGGISLVLFLLLLLSTKVNLLASICGEHVS